MILYSVLLCVSFCFNMYAMQLSDIWSKSIASIGAFFSSEEVKKLSVQDQLLLTAVLYTNDAPTVYTALQEGANPNIAAEGIASLLEAALERGNLIICLHLVQGNARLDVLGKSGKLPLLRALDLIYKQEEKETYSKLVHSLIDKGPCPQDSSIVLALLRQDLPDLALYVIKKFLGSVTKLHNAVRFYTVSSDEMLNVPDANSGDTPLIVAIKKDFTAVARKLIKSGININIQNKEGWSALLTAIAKNRSALIILLISRKADINTTNKWGLTPLLCALFVGNDTLALLLLNDVHVKVDVGGCFLPDMTELSQPTGSIMHSVRSKGKESLVGDDLLKDNERLESYRAIEKDDFSSFEESQKRGLLNNQSEQWTPLLKATDDGKWYIVNKLLQRKAPISTTLNNGCTVLHLAAKHKDIRLWEALMAEETIDQIIDKPNTDGVTPLHEVVNCDNVNAMDHLIEKGARVNCVTKKHKWTPLHLAVKSGNAPLVRALLDHSHVRLDLQDNKGYTPLHLAVLGRYLEIAQLLVQKGAKKDIQDAQSRTPYECALEVPQNTEKGKHPSCLQVVNDESEEIVSNDIAFLKPNEPMVVLLPAPIGDSK